MDAKKGLLGAAVLFAVFLQSLCIIGGKVAAPHSRPYMVSIFDNGKHDCGGFLVAEQWALSAAHCFSQALDGKIILSGAHSLTEAEDSKQTFQILKVFVHPDYSSVNYDNDIALVKLDRPIISNDAVKPLKFLREGGSNPDTGAEVNTAGWGSLNNLGTRPDLLQEVYIAILPRDICGRYDYYGDQFTSNMLCAAKRRMDACDGDSGGPLLYNGVAVGVTSNGGKKCGSSKKPGLYTIISHYTKWIDETMTQ